MTSSSCPALLDLLRVVAVATDLAGLEVARGRLEAWALAGADDVELGVVAAMLEARRADLVRLAELEGQAAALGRSEARSLRVLEDAPAAIAMHHGPRHRFTLVNRCFREATDGRQILGLEYAEAFPEFVDQGYVEIFDGILATGEPFVAGATRADTPRTPGGPVEERYWNVVFQPSRDAEGVTDGVVTFAFEVTEQVMARREAEAARERLLDLAQAVGAHIWEMEPESWVPFLVEHSEVPPEDAGRLARSATSWWARVHPDDLLQLREARAQAVRGGAYNIEYRVGDAEDGWRWLFESGTSSRDTDDGHLAVRGLTLDVTAQREALAARSRSREAELEGQRLESLGLLAGGVAHDFNNMLTAMLGQASVARLRLEAGHPAHQSLDRIETSANSASTCAALTLVALGTKLSRTDSSLAFICVSRWPPLRLGGERSVRFAAE